MKDRVYSAVLLAVVALMATAARADTVGLVHVSQQPGHAVATLSEDPAMLTGSAFAGSYNSNIVPDPPGPPSVFLDQTNPVPMFCIDLDQSPPPFNSAPHTYTLVQPRYAPLSSTETGNNYPMGYYRELWLVALAEQYWPLGGSYLDGSTELHYAAMQVAIWEIIYEGDDGDAPTAGSANAADSPWDATAGDFRILQTENGTNFDPYGVGVAANGLLDAVWVAVGASAITPADDFFLGALVNEDYQDFLIRTTEEIPEPTGLALAGLGLLGLVTRRRKRS